MASNRRQPGARRARQGLALVLGAGWPAHLAAAADRLAWADPHSTAWWLLAGSLAALTAGLLLLRRIGYRRLGRLWQCVAASVLVHIALTAALSFVVVSQPVLRLLGEPRAGETPVTLVVGQEARLRMAVRYQLTELPVADPSLAMLMRAAPETISSPDYHRTTPPAPPMRPRREAVLDAPGPAIPSGPPPAEPLAIRPPAAEAPDAATVAPPRGPVAAREGPPRPDARQPAPLRPAFTAPSTASPSLPPDPTPGPARPRPQSLAAAPRHAPAAPPVSSVPLPPMPDIPAPLVTLPRGPAGWAPAVEPGLPPPSLPPPKPLARRPDGIPPVPPRLDVPPPRPARPRPVSLASPAPFRRRPGPAETLAFAAGAPAPADLHDLAPPPGRRIAAGRPVDGPPAAARPLPTFSPRPTAAAPGPDPARSAPSVPRVEPAHVRGGALRSHLAARPAGRICPGWDLERFLPPLRPVGPGELAAGKMEVRRPIVRRQRSGPDAPPPPPGGTKISERAVQRALAWLARNQEPDGRWTFIDEDGDMPGRRPAGRDDTGLTGLAVLCYLADGDRPDRRGKYQRTVAAGLAYLLRRRKADGDLRGDGDMYSHGIATLALGEAAAMTGSAAYGRAAIAAARFICRAQNRQTGGWRYAPGDVGDTSVLGWQVMALHSVARLEGFDIPAGTRAGVFRWLASVSRGRAGVLTGYQTDRPSRAMTAEAMFVRILLGHRPTAAETAEVTSYLAPPEPISPPNFYEWYYGSLALMQLRSAGWQKWNPAVRDRLAATQLTGGAQDGSWDPAASRWGAERGGRVYATALAALTLEVYYRYLPMLAPPEAGRAE